MGIIKLLSSEFAFAYSIVDKELKNSFIDAFVLLLRYLVQEKCISIVAFVEE